MEAQQKTVLFLCTGNSCRSQMAEAWVNSLRSTEWRAYSAGIETHGMNPHAVFVMAESGVDMSEHYSKKIDELKGQKFDLVVTVCDHAAEHCPTLPLTVPVKHAPFDDPPALAKLAANEAESLNGYRRVRDQIRSFIESPALP
mgnify:CR=1 FL=1